MSEELSWLLSIKRVRYSRLILGDAIRDRSDIETLKGH